MMRNSILLAGAALLALGGVAMAQEYPGSPAPDPAQQPPAPPETTTPPDASVGTTAPTAPDAGTTAPTTQPTPPATPETPSTTATPTPPETPAAPAPEAPATTATTGAAATVQADWAKYDKDADGGLTPLEFGEWVLASRGQDMTAEAEKTRQSKAPNTTAVKVLNATAGEFSKADADKDRKVSQTELSSYLAA